jgi:nitrogen fixation/metabolism regulation signal transduction histidine kinase
MRIQFKLILIGFVTIALLMAVVGFVGIQSTQEVVDRFDEIVDETTPAILALGKIESAVNKILGEAVSFALVESEALLIGEDEAKQNLETLEQLILSSESTKEDMRIYVEGLLAAEATEEGAAAAAAAAEFFELEEAKEELEYWEDEFAKVAEDETEQKFVEEIEEHESTLFSAAVALVNAKKDGKSGGIILDLKEELEAEEEAFEEVIDRAIENEQIELLEQDNFANAAAAAAAARILIIGVFVSVLLAIGMGVFISRSVARPLKELQYVAAQIIAGDFSVRAKVGSKDEIGQLAESFNSMTDFLVESRRLPENILRSMKDSLFVVDTKGNITEVNQSALDVLGYSKEELIGQPISKVFGNVAQKNSEVEVEESGKKKPIRYVVAKDQEEEKDDV